MNAQDKYGSTALKFASYWGHLSTVKLLIEEGANVNVQDNEGDTVLIFALRKG